MDCLSILGTMFAIWMNLMLLMFQFGVQEIIADCGIIDRSNIFNHNSTFIDYVSRNTRVGSQAKFVCERGAKLIADINPIAKCTNNGWDISHDLVRCELVKCDPDPRYLVIPNGSVYHKKEWWTYLFALGSGYSVVCDPGYEVDGSPLRICFDNGEWSDEPPKCTRIKPQCTQPKSFMNGVLHRVSNLDILQRFPNKTVYTVVCDSGFCVTAGSPIVICGVNGQWETEFPVCDPFQPDCPEPHPILNGRFIARRDDTTYSRYMYYYVECDPGFQLKGTRVRDCLEDGTWSQSESVQSCEAILYKCHVPRDNTIPRGIVKFDPGEELIKYYWVECDSGYQVEGTPFRICLDNGTWSESGSLPQCVQASQYRACIITCPVVGVLVLVIVVVVAVMYLKRESRNCAQSTRDNKLNTKKDEIHATDLNMVKHSIEETPDGGGEYATVVIKPRYTQN